MGFLERLFGSHESKAVSQKQQKNDSDGDSQERIESCINQIITEGQGFYSVKKNVPIAELENRYGQNAYERKAVYAEPEPIAYVLLKNEEPVMYIRTWDEYSQYNHKANRSVKKFCDDRSIKIMDFFLYLPNETEYVNQRIKGMM